MAAVKAKKPVTKLQAGKKKKVNKWLVAGGVVVVAIIGTLVVRFSSASKWTAVAWARTNITLTDRDSWRYGVNYTLKKNDYARTCIRAYSTHRTKSAVMSMSSGFSGYRRFKVTPQGGVYCTTGFRAVDTQTHIVVGTKMRAEYKNDSGPDVWVVATSVEVLK